MSQVKQNYIGQDMKQSDSNSGLQRRKILGWLGFGAVGALIFRLLPMKKAISKRFLHGDDEEISISINKNAVKRSGKIKKNG